MSVLAIVLISIGTAICGVFLLLDMSHPGALERFFKQLKARHDWARQYRDLPECTLQTCNGMIKDVMRRMTEGRKD